MPFLSKRRTPPSLFREVHDQLIWPARAYARRTLGTADADDVVQQSFFDLWQSFYAPDRTPPADPSRAFFRILRRRVADEIKRLRSAMALEERQVFDLTERLEQRQDPTLLASADLLAARVFKAVNDLSPERRQLFEALVRHDGDVRAAADAIGIPYRTAREHARMARRHLEASLEPEGYTFPQPLPRGRHAAGAQQKGEEPHE